MPTKLVDEATALELDAERYPDERAEILLEAAEAWRRAGRPDRAKAVLAGLIEGGGEDGCFARFQLADLHFAEEAVDEGYAELNRLARDPALHNGHCELVAELLAEHSDLEGALRWYDRAVARLSEDELEALRGPDGWLEMASVMLRGRRDVRRRLGLPPDIMDETAPAVPPQGGALDVDDILDEVESGEIPHEVQALVFPRPERAEARRRWPQEFAVPDEEYYPAQERRWRELAAAGVPAIRVTPATVAGLRAFAETVGGSPVDPVVQARYREAVAGPASIAWPPPRNGPCWCGSSAKYKKCCARTP